MQLHVLSRLFCLDIGYEAGNRLFVCVLVPKQRNFRDPTTASVARTALVRRLYEPRARPEPRSLKMQDTLYRL